jgi:hypothetical protein
MIDKVKIMIGVATYPGHSYIRDEFKGYLDALVKATVHPVHVVILWNGEGKPQWYYKGYDCRKMNFRDGVTGIQILEQKHNELRRIFLKSDCTHFFMLESDNLPPADTLNRLVAHDVPLVQGTYLIRAEQTMKHFVEDNFSNRTKYKDFVGNYVFAIKVEDRPCFWALEDGKARMGKLNDIIPQRGLIEVYAGSMGTTLIKREVIEKIKFRIRAEGIRQFTDFLFWHDARVAGYVGYTDTDILVGHKHPENEFHAQDKWFKPLTLEAV